MPQFLPFHQTDLAVLEPPEDGRNRRLFDAECPGLGVFVSRDGLTRVFFAYKWEEGMEEPIEVEIGPVDSTPLKIARRRAIEILGRLEEGRRVSAGAQPRYR